MKSYPEMNTHGIFSVISLFGFFAVVTAALWYLFYPVINAIIMSLILSGIAFPTFRFIRLKLKFKETFSAMLTCIAVTCMTIIPFFFLASRLSIEIYGVYEEQTKLLNLEIVQSLLSDQGVVLTKINEFLGYVGYKISTQELTSFLFNEGAKFSQYAINFLKDWITNTFSYTLSFALNFLVMLLSMYAILLKGKQLRKFVFYVLPLNPYRSKIILKKFNRMNFATLVVNGVGGLLQGIFAGFSFWIVGFDSIVLWTFMMVLLAFIPLLGISLVYVPATAYLLYQGEYFSATFIFVFCTVVALIVENWYKPNLIGKAVEINSIFLLLSMIAGLTQFGALGIFYGPIIITLFLSFSDFIKSEFVFSSKNSAKKRHQSSGS